MVAACIAADKTLEELTLEEFQSYVWDEKAAARGEDKPVKANDHCMDAVRYFVNTVASGKKIKLKTFQGGI